MIRAAVACGLLAAALAVQAASSVAFVADVRGAATIEGNGPVKFLQELAPGTRLLLGTGAVVSITFAASGTEFTVSGPGEFAITASEVKADKGKPPAKRTVATLDDPAVVTRTAQTATASVRMRGLKAPAAAPAVLEYPVDARVATLHPVLRWKGDMSTEGVTVRIQDEAGNEVWKAKMLPNAAPPAVKLSPATRYKWTIMTPKGALAEARFETLSVDAVARAEKSRASAKSFSERVAHALLLQDLGATHDARELWGALARERPDLPELAALAR